MAFINFYELEVYKQCRKFRKQVSFIVKNNFPKEEKFQLTSQILNSSRSVTANIAEGHGRFHFQENIQFVRISRGSLSETLDHLITAFDENYISKEELEDFKIQYDQCLKLLNGYIRYLQKSKSQKTNF